MSTFSHIDASGKANMVDVTEKASSQRTAMASGQVYLSKVAFDMVKYNTHKKGDVLSVAKIAGIQAAKKCADLIPLCHTLCLTKVDIDFVLDENKRCISIKSLCKVNGQTGVEMEALTAVSVCALTIYDMCKAVDQHIRIDKILLESKKGGKADFQLQR